MASALKSCDMICVVSNQEFACAPFACLSDMSFVFGNAQNPPPLNESFGLIRYFTASHA